MNAEQAAELVRNSPVTILDIRTAGEFQAGHIAGAVNIDFQGGNFAAELGKLDRAKPYLVYCRSGNRSGRSLATFEKLGFTKIHHLAAGFNGWTKAGLPVVK